MDGKESNIVKMDQKKRISISKIDKIFKVNSLLNYISHFPLAITWTCNQHCMQSACKFVINKPPINGHSWGQEMWSLEKIFYVFNLCHDGRSAYEGMFRCSIVTSLGVLLYFFLIITQSKGFKFL